MPSLPPRSTVRVPPVTDRDEDGYFPPEGRKLDLWEMLDEARESLHSARAKAARGRDSRVDGQIRALLTDARNLINAAEKELL